MATTLPDRRAETAVKLGSELRHARNQAGVPQQELARRTGVSRTLISEYEQGRKEVSVSALRRLLDGLGYTAELILRPKTSAERGAEAERTIASLPRSTRADVLRDLDRRRVELLWREARLGGSPLSDEELWAAADTPSTLPEMNRLASQLTAATHGIEEVELADPVQPWRDAAALIASGTPERGARWRANIATAGAGRRWITPHPSLAAHVDAAVHDLRERGDAAPYLEVIAAATT